MSNAFSGCCGFGGILNELEGKADTVPSTKPMAKKLSQLANRKKATVAKAAAKAAAAKAAAPGKAAAKGWGKAPPVAKAFFLAPTAKCAASAPAKAPGKAPGAKCAAAPAKAPGKAPPVAKAAPAKAKNMSRKCVHSRAYAAAAKIAKAEGLDAAQVSEAACAAGKAATLQWDEQFGA